MNLAVRLDRLEKAVGVGQKRTILCIIESTWAPPGETRTIPALPEQVADWITAQPQLTAQRESALAVILVCPELERAAQAKAQGIPYEIDEKQVWRLPSVHVQADRIPVREVPAA